MIGKGSVIENDLFDIAARLKQIDSGYFVYYSYAHKRYEVHHSEQKGGTLALVVPYGKLDSRTLALALRTRRERKEQILAELERENARLEAAQGKRIVENALEKVCG